MEYGNLLRNSLDAVIRNIVAYAAGTIVFVLGSMFVITGPPLLYGFITMFVKGARQEQVDIEDIFEGFRSGNFVRSWKYMLFMMIIGVLLMIFAMILLFLAGLIMLALTLAAGSALPESLTIAIMVVIYLIVLCIILIPVFFMLYLLPLYVIKGYDVTDALEESARIVRENIMTSVIVSLIVGFISIIGSLPYYAGLFLEWPIAFNLFIYTVGVLLTMPFSQQVLVNATFELGFFPESNNIIEEEIKNREI